jgi:hypothetical protein
MRHFRLLNSSWLCLELAQATQQTLLYGPGDRRGVSARQDPNALPNQRMEKFGRWRDAGTGINPFLPNKVPCHVQN